MPKPWSTEAPHASGAASAAGARVLCLPAPQGARAMAEEVAPTWFKVHYGSAETALFNADCWAVVLLDYIKERCGYLDAFDEPIDLLKSEDNQCINLLDVGKEYATKVVAPKGTYILAKCIINEDGSVASYEPLYNPPEGYEPPPAAPAGKKK